MAPHDRIVKRAALVTPRSLIKHALGQENIWIMYHQARFALLLSPLLAVAACASGPQHTTRLLDQRLQDRLGPDIAAGNAAFQALPDGARVTILSTSLFPNDVKVLDGQHPDIRSSIVEGLLDPNLMRVQVTDTAALPEQQRAVRIQNVNQYFVAYGLESTLQTAAPAYAASGPAGLTIDIRVQCPAQRDLIGYDSGKSTPVCD
jgi:hypothetical protein